MLKFKALGGVITLLLVLFLFVGKIQASESDGWLRSPLFISRDSNDIHFTPSLNGNIDCIFVDAECSVQTPYGYTSNDGQVMINGTDRFIDVLSYVDHRNHFIGIANSNKFITYTTEPINGLYFYFTDNFYYSVAYNSSNNKYKINSPPSKKLADKSGKSVVIDYESVSFSRNGEWMVASYPNLSMVRVNLKDYSLVPFAPSFIYGIGLNPSPQTAISSDGRYAAVASKDFNSFKIYDLSSCSGQIPDNITGPVPCSFRDMNTYLTNVIPGYISTSNIRFINDGTISVFISYKDNGVTKQNKFIISVHPGKLHLLDYLALGDSYISGEGAYSYLPGTDTKDNSCHLSQQSYPLLLGMDLNFNSYHSVACSGAKTADIIDTSSTYSGQTKNKVERQDLSQEDIDRIISQFQVGYIEQLEFVTTYQPGVVTVSIGGNDIGFSDILRRCLAPDTCYGTYEDRIELINQINSGYDEIVRTYTNLKNSSLPDTRIYAVGYPQIANPEGSCALNVHLNKSELEFSKLLISYLDAVIKTAADNVGVEYIDTQSALDGYRLCEGKPGLVAVNGLTAGNDYGPIGKESFHPNQLGHELLEQYIREYSEDLQKDNPAPTSESLPPTNTLEILNAPKTGRPIAISGYAENMAPDSASLGQSLPISINAGSYFVQPNSQLQVVVHSSPTNLGTFKTDESGYLSANVKLPLTLSAGIHELHLLGTDIFGRTVDIHKTIVLQDSSSSAPCFIVPASGIDSDKDNVDDACDGYIGAAPISSNPAASSVSTASVNTGGIKNEVTEKNPDPPLALSMISLGEQSIKGASTENRVLAEAPSRKDGEQRHLARLELLVASLSILTGIIYWKLWSR